MRRLAGILLLSVLGVAGALMLAVAGAYFYLQTGVGKEWLSQVLARALSTSQAEVTITGLSGAPPFDLQAESIHIQDQQGTWLEVQKALLVIDGQALLRGGLAIRQLRAATLRVKRSPKAESTAAKAGSFDLSPPRLPIDVRIDELVVESLLLEPAVLGQRASMTLRASGRLVKGQAELYLTLRRTDGKPGNVDLNLSLAGDPAVLDAKAEAYDPTGMFADTLLQRADHAPLTITLAGNGPIADWRGNVQARLGNLLRLQGNIAIAAGETYRVSLQAEAHQDGLFPPNIATLVGDELKLDVALGYDGKKAVKLDHLRLLASAGEFSADRYDGSAGRRRQIQRCPCSCGRNPDRQPRIFLPPHRSCRCAG